MRGIGLTVGVDWVTGVGKGIGTKSGYAIDNVTLSATEYWSMGSSAMILYPRDVTTDSEKCQRRYTRIAYQVGER